MQSLHRFVVSTQHLPTTLKPATTIAKRFYTSLTTTTIHKPTLNIRPYRGASSNNHVALKRPFQPTRNVCTIRQPLRTMTMRAQPISTSLIGKKQPPLHTAFPTLLTTTKRSLFGFGTPDRIAIPGAKVPVPAWKRFRKWVFRFGILAALMASSGIYLMLYFTDHLDEIMRFNIRFRGQSDIHYYATASRVNHKYNPQFTGDKVSDIKLLQAKLIRDIYKIYLATDPMERNQDLINRYLGDKKVTALREMAAQDPELAAEITKEVFLEAQYGLTVTTDVVSAILQNILSIYLSTTFSNPNHRHSVEHLHHQFETLRVLEQDLEPMVEFTTACLDALVEGSVATPYQDPKKIQIYDPNLINNYVVEKPSF